MITTSRLSSALTAPIRIFRDLVDPPARSVAAQRRSEVGWGIVAVAVIVVMALSAVGLYVFTPGQYRITADFEEAGQIRVGDNVRVAGVPVGAVAAVTLDGDHVSVQMAIDDGVFIGADSAASAKMLTVVGGTYVDIVSVGDEPLGDRTIPVDQTSVPYSLTEVFQIAQPKIAKIDGNPLRKTLAELSDGLQAHPGAVKKDLTILSSMLTNLNKRQDEFGAMLQLAAEYTRAADVNGDAITALVRNLSSFTSEYADFGDRLVAAVEALAGLLAKLQGVSRLYATDLDPLVRQIDAIGREFGPALRRYQPLIERGRDLITRLENSVRPDGTIAVDHSSTILSSDLCVPVPGVQC